MPKVKPAIVEFAGQFYLRIPIRTHEIKPPDDLFQVVKRYTEGIIREGDILVLSSKAVAAAQGRLYRTSEIKPRPLAKFLSSKVTKNPYGIGLASPETMEMAIRECGTWRILLASVFGLLGKLIGPKGTFLSGRRETGGLD